MTTAAIEITRLGSLPTEIKKNDVNITISQASPETTPPPSQDDTHHLDKRRLLQQSPYTEPEHLLDLTTLDTESALLAQALTKMRNVRDDYATAPYKESFNWDEIMEELRLLASTAEGSFPSEEAIFYVVAFRSRIKPDTDYSALGGLDKLAHAEAIASGGFLKYWFGNPDDELRNLATCVWRSREDAIAGGRGPAHRRAAGSTRTMYADWKIDQLRLVVGKGGKEYEISEWEER